MRSQVIWVSFVEPWSTNLSFKRGFSRDYLFGGNLLRVSPKNEIVKSDSAQKISRICVILKGGDTDIMFGEPSSKSLIQKANSPRKMGERCRYLQVIKDCAFHVNAFHQGRVVTVIPGRASPRTSCCRTGPRKRSSISWPKAQIRLRKSLKNSGFPLPASIHM